MLGDLKFAWRQLWKSPEFTLTAVVTLMLGVGANALVFGVFNALVLRPLNLPQAQNLYMIERGKEHSPEQSYPDYLDLRDRGRGLEGLMAYDIARAAVDTGSGPLLSWFYEASGNYFDVVGVQPYLGRFFHGSDEHGPNSCPYIVLSYGYWNSHFRGDPGVVGRTVQLNKYPFTVVGVAPPEFRGTELFFAPDFWVPIVNQSQAGDSNDLHSRAARVFWVVGRVRSGVSQAQLTDDMDAIAKSLAKTYPREDEGMSFSLARPGLIGDTLGRPVRAFLMGLTLLAALILLAACANLGSLFAARTSDRSKEVALRLALGSSRRLILRQLLTEALMVALIGGVFGLVASVILLRWLSTWHPLPNNPVNIPVYPDARIFIVALLLACISGLLFGIVPIRQVLKVDPYRIIKTGSTGATELRRLNLRDVLLAIQIGVCTVLVTASLVAVHGLVLSLQSNFGFVAQNAMLVSTDLGMARYSGEQLAIMQRRMLDAAETIPGVTAAYIDRVPLGLSWNDSVVFTDSTTDLRPSNVVAHVLVYNVSPRYFNVAGTTLLSGRSFDWHDDKSTPRVAIVNLEFARKVFGTLAKAIGSYYKTSDGTRVQVVGVVEDGKYTTLTEDPRAAMFFPFLQSPSGGTSLVLRSYHDPQQLTAAVERTLHSLDPGLPLTISTWHRELDSALFAARAATVALGVLGVMGTMLAITGLFGMAAYSVSKRLRELGIRMALGAQQGQVLGAALGRVFRLLAFGSLAGLLLSLAVTRVLSYLVYRATPWDPLVLAGVVFTMLLLGLLAAWIPARRALAVDPLILLREG